MIILVYYLFLSASRLAEKRRVQAQLETTQVGGRGTKMLKSQIKPHFSSTTSTQ
jgi:hypothetical protein